MKIACTVGHSTLKNGNSTSANGVVNEYKWCKEFVPMLVDTFKSQGVEADLIICPEKVFTSASEEKPYKLNKIKNKGYDLVIESHLNAFNGSAKGTEVLYYPTSSKSKAFAQRVNDKLDDIFTDRGIKGRDNLYILRDTPCPSILIEYFFCDNSEDYSKANTKEKMQLIANKVVEGVLNKELQKAPTTSDTKLYAVCVGAYSKSNADGILEEVKKKGYTDAYLIPR